MHPIYESGSSKDIERQLAQADQELNEAFAQTPDEVRELEALFGTTPRALPADLQNPAVVLNSIKKAEASSETPSSLGKLITFLRTEKCLSIEQLAAKTDLDIEELVEIESSSESNAGPRAVVVLATFFKLSPMKLQRLAGLTHDLATNESESLGIAACAKPDFRQLTKQERVVFHHWVKQLRK
jgi:hypothetical protein